MQITPTDAQLTGCFQLVPRMHPHRRTQQFTLETADCFMERTPRGHVIGDGQILKLWWQIFDSEMVAAIPQNHAALNYVLQFANVARPAVAGQCAQEARSQATVRLLVGFSEGPQKVFREEWNIVSPFAEWRQVNSHH